MKNSTKYIVTPVIISALSVSGYTTMKMKAVQKENIKLKNEIQNKVDKPIVYNVTIDDIKEINKKNVELIVYESGPAKYELNLTDNSWFGIDAHINTNFKYIVTIDMSKSKITSCGENIIVHVDLDDIKLKEVVVDQPTIKYDTNLITRLRGKKIIEIETDIMTRVYNGIDRAVNVSCEQNRDTFKINLIEKLNKLYDANNVKVTFE